MMFFNRNAAPVILDNDGTVGVNDHAHMVGIAGHYLVNAIINHLVDQVMQTALVGRANIHTWTHTHGFQTL